MKRTITYSREEVEETIKSLESGIKHDRRLYIKTGNEFWSGSIVESEERLKFLGKLLDKNKETKVFEL